MSAVASVNIAWRQAAKVWCLLLTSYCTGKITRWRSSFSGEQSVMCNGVDGMEFQTIPIMRIFDEEKAKEFYLGFLGMELDWEHRFEDGYPIYMQVSLGDFVLHLSEHSGDCTPGSKVFVNVSHIDQLFAQVTAKPYKYNKPSIEDAPWGARCFTVTDPFSNRILFNESADT